MGYENGGGIRIDVAADSLCISPTKDQERNHGGKRDRCPLCKGYNTRRIFHLQCLNPDCQHEDIRRQITDDDRELANELEEEKVLQLPELPGTSDLARAIPVAVAESFPLNQVGSEVSTPLQSIIPMQQNANDDELADEIEEALAPTEDVALADQVGQEEIYTCIVHNQAMKIKLTGTMEVIFCPKCELAKQLDRHNNV